MIWKEKGIMSKHVMNLVSNDPQVVGVLFCIPWNYHRYI